jgi:hypothetical protein
LTKSSGVKRDVGRVKIKPIHSAFAAVLLGAAALWFGVSWESKRDGVESHSEPAREPPTPTSSITNAAPQQALPVSKSPPAVAPVVSPQPSAAPAAAPTIPAPERTGPVDELAELFAREPRASDASALEAKLAAPFRRPEVPAGLLASAICRATVCRVEARWSPDRAQGFLAGLMQLVAQPGGGPGQFDPKLAIAPEETAAADGSRAVTVYLRSPPRPAAEP